MFDVSGNRHKKKAEKGNNLDENQNLLLSKREIKRFTKLNKWSNRNALVIVCCSQLFAFACLIFILLFVCHFIIY